MITGDRNPFGRWPQRFLAWLMAVDDGRSQRDAWLRFGTRAARLLVLGGLGLRRRPRTLTLGMVILGVALCSILVYPIMFPAPQAEGLIIVDAPQLFTRERLVNERLRASEWIDEQIKGVATKLDDNEFAQLDRVALAERFLSLRGQLGPGPSNKVGSDKDADGEQIEGAERDSALALLKELSGLRPSPLTAFEAANDYRERLSMLRYATILDDAHDIGENTLHRINFGLTITPAGPLTDRLVGVSLRMRQAFDQGNMLDHYARLMVDLRKQLQLLINELMMDRGTLFNSDSTSYRLEAGEEAAIDLLLARTLDDLAGVGAPWDTGNMRARGKRLVDAALSVSWQQRQAAIRQQLEAALDQKSPAGFWNRVASVLTSEMQMSFLDVAVEKIGRSCAQSSSYSLLELSPDRAAIERVVERLAVDGEAHREELRSPIRVTCWKNDNAATIAKLRVLGILHHLKDFATQDPYRCDDSVQVHRAVHIVLSALPHGLSPPLSDATPSSDDCSALVGAAERLSERQRMSGAEIGQTGLAMLIRDELENKKMETTRRSRTLGAFFRFDISACTVERCEVQVYTKSESLRYFGREPPRTAGQGMMAGAPHRKPLPQQEGASSQPIGFEEMPEQAQRRYNTSDRKAFGPVSEEHIRAVGQREALRLFLELVCFSDARSYTVWPRASARTSTLSSRSDMASAELAVSSGTKGGLGARGESSLEVAGRSDVDHIFGIGDWGDTLESRTVATGEFGTIIRRGGDARPQCSSPLAWVLEHYEVDDELSFVDWMEKGKYRTEGSRNAEAIEKWWQRINVAICEQRGGTSSSSPASDLSMPDPANCVVDLQMLAEYAVAQHDIDTRVAWVVMPRGNAQDGTRGHAAMSQPLAAIVSLPSWWGGLEIEVSTCWLRPSALQGQVTPGSLCNDERRAPNIIHLPLPGRPQEVLQKLGFFILRTPYLDLVDFEQLQVIEAGRPAEIRLTGGRLWKNPRVRLGSQWHDRIEVLPDMQGLIARFECVEPSVEAEGQIARLPTVGALHFGTADEQRNSMALARNTRSIRQGTQESDAQEHNYFGEFRTVQVWTSEGYTGPQSVEIRPFRPRHFVGGEPERPCWLGEEQATEVSAAAGG